MLYDNFFSLTSEFLVSVHMTEAPATQVTAGVNVLIT